MHRRSSTRPRRSRPRCRGSAVQAGVVRWRTDRRGLPSSSSRPPPFSATAVRTGRGRWVGARVCQGMLHRSGSSVFEGDAVPTSRAKPSAPRRCASASRRARVRGVGSSRTPVSSHARQPAALVISGSAQGLLTALAGRWATCLRRCSIGRDSTDKHSSTGVEQRSFPVARRDSRPGFRPRQTTAIQGPEAGSHLVRCGRNSPLTSAATSHRMRAVERCPEQVQTPPRPKRPSP